MIKFPSIEQFRNVIKNVTHKTRWDGLDENGAPKYNVTKDLPTIKYRGTVKLHGTNAGIVFNMKTKEFTFQSRERELTLTSDNAGFALFMESKKEVLTKLIDSILENHFWFPPNSQGVPTEIVLFGEWCGGNIQASVAINGLPKMFVIFAIKLIFADERTQWLNIDPEKLIEAPEHNIHSIAKFPSWELDIDFAKPHETQNQLIDLTIAVETECPVGKYFGKEGVGEGIVWKPVEALWMNSDYWFKVKGEKHSASKVKTLAAVDVEAIRVVEDFVEMAVTEARLEQGLQNLLNEQLKPFEMTSMGDFIRWVFNDVVKEEQDTIVASQLDPKKLGGPIANKARKWFIEKYNAEG